MVPEIVQLLIIFTSIYLFIFWFLVLVKYHKSFHKKHRLRGKPSITIVIPAYNAEKTIEKAVKSCLKQDYPVDVVVVNDGSTDRTGEILKKFGKKIRVIAKKNTGKADSLNKALKTVKTEYFACLDADSWFINKSAIRNGLAMFEEDVGAVTPCMFSRKGHSVLERIQWFEYLLSIYLRKLMAFLNIIYVTPGPGSIYRTKLVKKLGGFDKNNLVEDTDIALKIQKSGYRIENSLHTMVETDVPTSFAGLLKQRIRWYTGYMENMLFKHADLIFDTRNPHLGVFLIPTNFVVQALMIYTFFYAIYLPVKSLSKFIHSLMLIDFDILPYLQLPHFEFSLSFLSWFIGIGFVFSVLFILAIESFMPKRTRSGLLTYVLYMLLYMPLLYLFFSLSFLNILKRFVKREINSDRGWRGTKVQ